MNIYFTSLMTRSAYPIPVTRRRRLKRSLHDLAPETFQNNHSPTTPTLIK